MIIDKNGKLFGKINLIDFAVVVLIIVAIFGISLRFTSEESKLVKEEAKITYSAKIENVRIHSINALSEGASVFSDGEVIGEIVDLEYEPYKIREIDARGNQIEVEIPDRYVAYVDVTVDGNVTEKGYFINGNDEISVDSMVLIRTRLLNAYAKITDIKVEN